MNDAPGRSVEIGQCNMLVRIVLVLACVVAAPSVAAQSPDEPSLTVRGRRHHDGCVSFDGPVGWHRLPAGDETLVLPAAREGAIVEQGAVVPRGLHPDEDDSARARLEAVARADMRHVLEELQPRIVARLTSMHLPSGERWLHVSSHVGTADDRAVFQAHVVSSPHTPFLGSQTENLVVDTRQCPIAYTVPSPYGPIACTGRRVEIEIGPHESPFPGVMQYVVVDYCFEGHAAERLTERSYVVRGPTRSFFPLVSEADMRQFVVSLAQEVAWHASNAIQQVAGVSLYVAGEPSDVDVREAAQNPVVPDTPVEAARCDRAIAQATTRYFALVHALDPGPEPSNAFEDRVLEAIAGRFEDRYLAALGGSSPTMSTPALLIEARRRLPAILSELEHDPSTGIHCESVGSPPEIFGYTCTRSGPDARHASLEVVLVRSDPTPPDGERGPVSFMLRMCERGPRLREGEISDGIRNWRRCSELHFDPAPNIVHGNYVVDTVDPNIYGTTSLGVAFDGTRFTPLESFVARALILSGRRACVPRVRPLQWLDTPARPRRHRGGS